MIRFSRYTLVAFALACIPLPLLAQAPNVTATKSDGTPAATKKNPGETVTYTHVISNAAGAGSATGVQFADPEVAGAVVVANSVKVSPLAIDDAYPHTVVANTSLDTDASSEFSVTANDYVGMAAGVAASITITSYDSASANGGTVSMVTSGANMGKFTYAPAPGFTGADSFTYTITNSGSLANTGIVSLTVSGPVVWFVDASSGNDTTGKGTMALPFATVTKAGTVDAANHKIYVATGTYSATAITLETNEALIGQGAVAASFDSLAFGATTPGADTAARPSIGGSKPTLTRSSGGSTLTLGQNNLIQGCSITNTGGGYAITGTTVNIAQIGNATTSDVDLGSSGTSSGALNLSGGNGSVSINAPITTTAGRSVTVANRSGSSVTFSQAISDSATGISLNTNIGSTLNFTGGITASTGSNAAFTATGGGTVNVTGSNNTLITTTATALNVANTTIGASGLTFQSITAGTAAGSAGVGIILDNTGSTTGLTVTGTGSAASGGTIRNKTGSDNSLTSGIGIYLNNTAHVSLSRMQLNDFENSAIRGFSVTHFTLTNSVISGVNGNASGPTEGAITFGTSNPGGANGLLGTGANASLIDNVDMSGAVEHTLEVYNQSGSFGLTISNSNIHDNSVALGGDGIQMEMQGTATATVLITGNQFSNNKSQAIQIAANDSSAIDSTIRGNTITRGTQGNEGIILSNGSNGDLTAMIGGPAPDNGNTLTGFGGVSIFVGQTAGNATASSLLQATIQNNNITTVASATNHAVAAFLSSTTGVVSQARILIDSNTVNQLATGGVSRAIIVDTPDATRTPEFQATVTNNNVDINDGNTATAPTSITVQARNGAIGHFDVRNNDVDFLTPQPGGVVGIRVRQATLATAELARGGSASNDPAVVVAANNATASGTEILGTVAVINNGIVLSPSNPPLPLLFAPSHPALDAAGEIDSTAKAITWTEDAQARQANATDDTLHTGDITTAASALTQARLDALVSAARARWEATGLSETQRATLRKLTFEVVDLPGWYLGEAAGTTLRIDKNAGGNGWFIDETPEEDSEFAGTTIPSHAVNSVDLLTTVMHEMGHSLGLCDSYSNSHRESVMYGFLSKGERRLPEIGQATGATPHAHNQPHFLSAPIDIGVIPPGKSVIIIYDVVINDPLTTIPLTSQGTVSGSNFPAKLTDDLPSGGDPALPGAADPTVTLIERPDTTVASLNRTTTSPTNASSVTWQIVFANPISGLTAGNFSLVNTGLGGSPAMTSVTAATGAPASTWNITATTGTGSGSLGLNMANDAGLTYDVTNQPFPGQVYTLDLIPPVFTSIARLTPTAQSTNADSLVFRATFSESVENVNEADFTITGTGATITSLSGSGSQYDITVSGGDLASLDGTVGLSLAGGQNIADAAGNALLGTAPATNESYTLDNIAPTVAITSATGNPAPNAVIPVTVTFSESVTGFDLTDINITGGSKTNFAGTGAIYTFDLTPSGPGVTVTADIAASAAQDTAGNENTAATQFTRTIVDAVSIAAATATAVEGGATGLYTFTRGSSTGDLTISFQLDAASTATAGTDFNLTSSGTLTFDTTTGAGTLVIPDGSTSATVTLTALTESPNPAEAAETARLNVVAGSGYIVGSPANATVTITENSFLVATTADNGTGSLRQAVLNANTIAGTDTITFDSTAFATPQTITLASQFSITSNLTIQGPTTARLRIDGNNVTRCVQITSGTVVLSDLEIAGGNAGTQSGGGIQIGTAGTLQLLRSSVTGSSGVFGGGINNSGPLTLVSSTISGNTDTNTGTGGSAGGIASINTSLTILNSTITGNTVPNAPSLAVGGLGGNGTITILNSTVTANSAAGGGANVIGGVLNAGAGLVTISNSLIAGNVNNATKPDVGGTFTSGGGNLIGNGGTATGFTTGTNSDQVGTGASPINPLLSSLANNGGPTQTHSLLSGSPALNAGLNAQLPVDTIDLDGDSNTTEVIDVDQRGTGFIRAIGTVDIGAFELQKSVSISDLAAISEGNSGTTNFVFTITRTGETTGDANMSYTVGGAAVNAADFGGTLPTGTATITAGNASTTVTIPVSGDTTVEPDEAFTITLSAPDNGYVVSGAPATSAVTNDDTATVSIAKVNDGAESNSPTAGKFLVTQTAASSTDTTVSYDVTGTATSGTDFTALSGSVTIPAGSTTADIDVPVLNESTTLEPTETVILTPGTVTAGDTNITLGSPSAATMDISDDDTATVTIEKIADGGEPATNALFRVTQTAAATVDTVLTYTVSGTATSGSDFTTPSGSVTIPAGQTTADISVTITNDPLVEGTETLSLTLTAFTAGDPDVTLGTTVLAAANITDNDTATLSILKLNDGEENTTRIDGVFQVTLSAPSSSDTTVFLSFSGSASGVADYKSVGNVIIPAGQTVANSNITIYDDNIVEPIETIAISLSSLGSHNPGIVIAGSPNNSATVNIADNDTATVSFAKITDGVEAAAPTNALFRVTQTAAASVDSVINYTVGGSATSGSDFTAASGSVTILAGQTTADISVAVINENVVEPAETVSLTLTGFTARDPEVTLGATVTASANITDDDTSVVTLAAVSADQNEGTGGSTIDFTFTATLSNPVQGGLTVAYTTNDVTALAGSDYLDSDGTLAFAGTANEQRIITIQVNHDAINELDETFTVALGEFTRTTLGSSLSTAGSPQTGTIRNDDALTVIIAATDADADENTAATGTYRVTRNTVLGSTTVQLAIDASSTAVAADWTQTGATFASLAPSSTGTIVIPDGSTFAEITLTPSADLHAEAAETVRFNITADAAYTLGNPANATVTIGQNDFLVINTNNAGEGALRQAILNANAITGDDTILFDDSFTTPKTINLDSPLGLSSNIKLTGPSGGLILRPSLSANNIINTGSGRTVSLSNLTFRDAAVGVNKGTAIVNITGCSFVNNGIGFSAITGITTCNILNSTFSGNITGLRQNNNGGLIFVTNCTFSGNTSGIFGSNPPVFLQNTLCAGNINNTIGGVIDGGGNILSGDAVSAGLDPLGLQNNGGPTQTIALVNGSPAINGGFDGFIPAGLTTDQRGAGFARTIGSAVDIGAYEAFAFEPTLTAATTNEDVQTTSGLVITANTADGGLTTHYKIASILNGTLFKNNGTTAIASGSSITKAEGLAGLKFTPAANLNNSNTPAGFGFSAQAAIGTSAGDERGTPVSVSVSVNAINDAPTVVLPGVSDQILTIGQNLNLPLSATFADIEGDPLNFTVQTNSNSSVASAVIFKDSVDLAGLASGTTTITILADDGQGGTITDSFLVSVGTVNPTPLQIGTTATLNRQNGLFELFVNVTNTTPYPINGFRLRVDYNPYKPAHPSLILVNASSPPGASDVYLDYLFPVAVDGVVQLKLSFYTNNRRFPSPFFPGLTVEKLGTIQVSGMLGGGVQPTLARLPDRSVRLEFVTVPGKWYRVRYSADLVNWFTSELPVQATGNLTLWIDKGPPYTNSDPAGEDRRFYLINEIPAP